ncbi:hypothetical protein LTR99_003027 [Exophiala xenobiotica]|uniref:Xylanolytic transcriptional activator regulatory domain-containing protein n=1 Tax=Vermiconidia calcicola TaxID=1690605 RepID=A0AAV9QCY7_9PEZI|nr:hypothetical protein LTR41_001713 [Exophiala xenobiotica]KAK5538695.1 hypothetical protein LTR25_004238 [Vermiconidia calcicola]KAK5547816.1 hypothetical protein LTR23_002064 [Chaetothyriales sp. CCFEE 6169]KAK5268094.1 hypothetical protein LTR96_006640 [Exophiala xenobiotica]KAK5305484.1 hypothetical protein LTR99_003027 [Exophiala xenobiotica]
MVLEKYGEALLYVICALGAKIYLQDNTQQFHSLSDAAPGSLWVEQAREVALREIPRPSLRTLMSMVLICEYCLRTGDNALAFVLWGICYQILRLLGLDSPSRMALDLTQREAERRVLWSCFILDSLIGSGVDENLHWHDEAPGVPLPCPDHMFVSQIAFTGHEVPAAVLFISPTGLRQLEIRSHVIYLAFVRTKVLRLIRHKEGQTDIWSPESSFLKIIEELEIWYDGLPEQFNLTDLNLYVQTETNIIGAVFMLHLFYHSIVADLTRVALSGFDFPLSSALRTAPNSFRKQCQQRCRFHADQVSHLIQKGMIHGTRAFDDFHCAVAAFESAKIQIVHTSTVTSNSAEERKRTMDNVRFNIKLLNMLKRDRSNPFVSAIISLHVLRFSDYQLTNNQQSLVPLLARFGFHELLAEFPSFSRQAQHGNGDTGEVTGPPEASYLSNAAAFRLAQAAIRTEDRRQEVSTLSAVEDVPQPVFPPPVTYEASQWDVRGLEGRRDQFGHTGHSTTGYGTGTGTGPQYLDHNDSATATFPGIDSLDDPSIFSAEDYIQLAGEMSNYLTWDGLETLDPIQS